MNAKPTPDIFSVGTPTLGVEEEFLLCDPQTGHPTLRNSEVAARRAGTRYLAATRTHTLSGGDVHVDRKPYS